MAARMIQNLFFLLLAGPAFAFPPPPGSPGYIPPPQFVDVDFDDVLQRVLKGNWETQPNTPAFKFEITGRKPHHFRLRVLSQPYCKALLIDQYARTVGYEALSSATDLRLTMAQIKFDGDRKETNCLGMPAWITFKFASPLNYNAAKVTVREQFVEGPDENEYEMAHHR
jgi:hypothetical protein